MTYQPADALSPQNRIRWILAKNVGSTRIGAWDAVEMVGTTLTDDNRVLLANVQVPTGGNLSNLGCNSWNSIAAGKRGQISQDFPLFCTYTADTPVIGELWGVTSSSGGIIVKDGFGFIVAGTAQTFRGKTVVRVVSDPVLRRDAKVVETTIGNTINVNVWKDGSVLSPLITLNCDWDWVKASATSLTVNSEVIIQWRQERDTDGRWLIEIWADEDSGAGTGTGTGTGDIGTGCVDSIIYVGDLTVDADGDIIVERNSLTIDFINQCFKVTPLGDNRLVACCTGVGTGTGAGDATGSCEQCGTAAKQFTFTLPGLANDGCADCADLQSAVTLTHTGGCSWSGSTSCGWTVTLSHVGSGLWQLEPSNSDWSYSRTNATWDCQSDLVLDRIDPSGSGSDLGSQCQNYPVIVTLSPV